MCTDHDPSQLSSSAQETRVYSIAAEQLHRWAELCGRGHGAQVHSEINRVIENGIPQGSPLRGEENGMGQGR